MASGETQSATATSGEPVIVPQKHGGALRPFPKGVSGNPSGGRRPDHKVRRLAEKNSTVAMQKIIDLIEDPDSRVAMAAAKEVLDRAYGKVRQAEDDSPANDKNVTINILKMTDDGSKPAEQLASPTVSVRPLALS